VTRKSAPPTPTPDATPIPAEDNLVPIGEHMFEPCATFPAFFTAQSSKTGSTGGEIDVRLSVPREGRDQAISLMDTHGEQLHVVVMRRVFL